MMTPAKVAQLLGLLALFCLGCSGSPQSTISGTVTLDDEPLSTGTVAFHPVESGSPAYGQINPEGKYSLKTRSHQALKPGRYKVTVVATKARKSEQLSARERPPELLTPPRYSDENRTEFLVTIKAGHNSVNLDLTTE